MKQQQEITEILKQKKQKVDQTRARASGANQIT